MKVELDEREWNQVVTLVANGPWTVANPLLMKIGAQLTAQGSSQGLQERPNGPDPGGVGPEGREGRLRPS